MGSGARPQHIFLLLLLAAFATGAHATTWTDPTWEQMINGAPVIGLFEVTEGGLHEGKLKPVRLLKGKLEKAEIRLAGFNDRYLAKDAQQEHALRKGERLYLLLERLDLPPLAGLQDELDPAGPGALGLNERTFPDVIVPSPTAGVVRVEEDDTVRYSLAETKLPLGAGREARR